MILTSTYQYMGEPVIVALGCEAQGDNLFSSIIFLHPGLEPGPYSLVGEDFRYEVEIPPALIAEATRSFAVNATLHLIGD